MASKKIKHKIYFRADGNSEIGLGHIYRSLSLMNMLDENFDCILLTKKLPISLQQELESKGVQVVEIQDHDEESEVNYLSKNILTPQDIVVLDGYHFDVEYQKEVKESTKALVCVDDLKSIHFHSDAIINHAPSVKESDYSKDAFTKFYGGLAYSILRPHFLNVAKQERILIEISTLFICFGGSDFNNLTTKVLHILSKKMPSQIKQIEVVLGGANPYKSEVQDAIQSFTNTSINLHINLSEEEMVRVMLDSDVAILPSSSILYEALAVKMPVISGYYVDNQEGVYNGFNDLGLIHGVGDINKFEDYHTLLTTILNQNPQLIIDKQRDHINGSSQENIRAIFSNLSRKLHLKKASIDDLTLYFDWANDDTVRKNAINKEKIILDNHTKWFNSKLEDNNCFMYILEVGDLPVGQVRFDIENQEAVIDYSVDHGQRGNGYGKTLLKEGMKQLTTEEVKVANFKGIVKKENRSSNAVFNKLGFEKTGDLEIEGEEYDIFKLNIQQ